MPRITRRFSVVLAAIVIAVSAVLPAQQGTLTPAEQQRRIDLERELQSLAVVERRVMIPMKDGVRLATDIYRPKDAAGQGADRLRQDAVQLQFLGRPQRRARRHVDDSRGDQARLCLGRPERARPFLLGGQLRHSRRADYRRLRDHRMADQAAVVERQARHHGVFIHGGMAAGRGIAQPSRLCGDERPGFWRRRRQGRAVLGTGQLVSRRRDADALHHLDLRPAESGPADVSEKHVAGRPDCGVAAVRSRARACRR